MKLTYYGHSCILIELENQTKILVDPFFTDNPLTQVNTTAIQADYILCTHGHNDHIGDLIPIGKRNNSLVIAIAELADFVSQKGLKAHGMNIGGEYLFPFGKVKMVEAKHSSSFQAENGQVHYLGQAAGFVVEAEGKQLYFAGDTAYFSDMALLKEDFQLDVAFIPIGDNFTMGLKDAGKCCEAIGTKEVIPIHYNTFPVIQQNPNDLKKYTKTKVTVMKPDETIKW